MLGSPKKTFHTAAATVVTNRVDLEALERFANRGDTCEECEVEAATLACEYCDEIFCAKCDMLCHLVDPQSGHERLEYPIPELGDGRYLGGGADGSWMLPTSPAASDVLSSPHSAGSKHPSAAAQSPFSPGGRSRAFTATFFGETLGLEFVEVKGRGFVVAGLDPRLRRSGAAADVAVGDVLVGVGARDVRGLSLADALGVLHASSVPRVLRFRRDPPDLIRDSLDPKAVDKRVAVTVTKYTVTMSKPLLGLLLEHTRAGLVVRGFDDGFDRRYEGRSIQIGDYLVSVNALLLDGRTLPDALSAIRHSSVPRILEFRRLIRHVVFSEWALNAPAELGAPPDHAGPISPDPGRDLFAHEGVTIALHGPEALPTTDPTASVDRFVLSPTAETPKPGKPNLISHMVLEGGDDNPDQYAGVGPHGAVGATQRMFLGMTRADNDDASDDGDAKDEEDEYHELTLSARLTLKTRQDAQGKAEEHQEAHSPPSPSTSFQVHSRRFPYLVAVQGEAPEGDDEPPASRIGAVVSADPPPVPKPSNDSDSDAPSPVPSSQPKLTTPKHKPRVKRDPLAPPSPPECKWWKVPVETQMTRVASRKETPRFKAQDLVMYFTRERAAGPQYVQGRVIAEHHGHRARRGKQSTYYYTIAWNDYTLVADRPDAELSAEEFEALRQARMRKELVEEEALELVPEYHTRLWSAACRAFEHYAKRVVLHRWHTIIAQTDELLHMVAAATDIQRVWRGDQARLDVEGMRRDRDADMAHDRKMAAFAAERVRNAEAKAAGGFTVDEVHYFSTKAELEAWMDRRTANVRQLGASLVPFADAMKKDAFHHWHTLIHLYKNLKDEKPDHLRNAEATAKRLEEERRERMARAGKVHRDPLREHAMRASMGFAVDEVPDTEELPDEEDGSEGKLEDAEEEKPTRIGFVEPTKEDDVVEEENWLPDPRRWHPALGFQELPRVPQTMGARVGTDGNIDIQQPAKWNSFRVYCKGSCDSTSWIIRNHVQIGPYPIGQADHTLDEVTAHSSMAAQLLLAGHNVYVNTMMPSEWQGLGATHEDDLVYKAQELRTNAKKAMEAAKAFYKREATKYKNSVKYSKEKRRQLKEKALDAKKKYEAARKDYQDFPSELHFINFPIPDEYAVADDLVLALCRELEARLRNNDRVYIFSLQGRGRCAVIGGCLLGRLYGIPSSVVLDYLAGSCYDRAFHIVPPPRAQKRLPTLKAVRRPEPSFDGGASGDGEEEFEKRDWLKGVMERLPVPEGQKAYPFLVAAGAREELHRAAYEAMTGLGTSLDAAVGDTIEAGSVEEEYYSDGGTSRPGSATSRATGFSRATGISRARSRGRTSATFSVVSRSTSRSRRSAGAVRMGFASRQHKLLSPRSKRRKQRAEELGVEIEDLSPSSSEEDEEAVAKRAAARKRRGRTLADRFSTMPVHANKFATMMKRQAVKEAKHKADFEAKAEEARLREERAAKARSRAAAGSSAAAAEDLAPIPRPTRPPPSQCPVVPLQKEQIRRVLALSQDAVYSTIKNRRTYQEEFWVIDKPRGQGVPMVSPLVLGKVLRDDPAYA